jgi:arylsulfatase A-like enzyme
LHPWSSLRLALLPLLVALPASAGTPDVPSAARWNVVLVVSDALRAASLPIYGYPHDTAPSLRRLAEEGVVFENHMAHYPGTPMSVSQLVTGRLMPPVLLTNPDFAPRLRGEPPDLFVLPRVLAQAGYMTAAVSAHFWFTPDAPLLAGIDMVALVPPVGDESSAPFERLLPPIRSFLGAARAAGRPFFLYVHAMDTHGPRFIRPGYEPPSGDGTYPEEYRRYDSGVLYFDHWLNEIVELLRGDGVLDRTVFVVTADHGEELGELGSEPWNLNHGWYVHRNMMHVPLLIRLPGGRGARAQALTRHIDVAPTLAHLADPALDLRPYRIEGRDLSDPIRRGEVENIGEVESIAFGPRYWGVLSATREVEYDRWSGEITSVRKPVRDALNYPRLEDVSEPEQQARWKALLDREIAAREQENEELPLPPPSAALEIMFSLMSVTASGPNGPVFQSVADDQRWSLGDRLAAAPEERPAPLSFRVAFVPGRYRVRLVTSKPSRRAGYANRFRYRIGANGDWTVASAPSPEGRIDLGEHEIGRAFEVSIGDPEGGVDLSSVRFELVQGAPAPTVDEASRERLRQLGYAPD